MDPAIVIFMVIFDACEALPVQGMAKIIPEIEIEEVDIKSRE